MSENAPKPKQPCYCPKCQGAVVSRRTFLNHAKLYTQRSAAEGITGYRDWATSGAGGSAGGKGDIEMSNEDEEQDEEASDDDTGTNERPSKRICNRDQEPNKVPDDLNQPELPPEQDFEHEVDYNGIYVPEPAQVNYEAVLQHNPEPANQEDELDAQNNDLAPEDPIINEDELRELQNDIEQEQAAQLHALLNPVPAADDEQPQEPAVDLPPIHSRIEHLRIAQQFIEEIKQATLDNGKLDEEALKRLRTPDQGPVDISDPDTRLSLDMFMACNNTSEKTYTDFRSSFLRRFPELADTVLTYDGVKTLVAKITGVVSIPDDMCINSCHAFTGPFADRDTCFYCSEPRYDPIELAKSGKRVPRKEACTIPIGPQVQALRRSDDGSESSDYRELKTREILEIQKAINEGNDAEFVYDDILCGNDFLDLDDELKLSGDDTTVIFSFDGARLYQNKKSDTWIAVWIICEYDPKTRYKKRHVLPACIIPGPNKPKNSDSFTFRSFHHLSAIQRENNNAGIYVWDSAQNKLILSRVVHLLTTADAVGLVEVDGRVGHHGAKGCRIGCPMIGRHKPSSGHYYAVHLRPFGEISDDCNHPDFDFQRAGEIERESTKVYQENVKKIMNSQDQNDYERNRKLTGLSKPTIISGLLYTIPPPMCFSLDLMHLSINLGELLIPLWRGILKCESTDDKVTWDWVTLTGDVWQAHGKLVAEATLYFPSSFHRPPRNPAEKISSGYKATEYFHYLFGLGPGFFRAVLPARYWRNFCKLVRGFRTMTQRRITGPQIREAHSYLVQFVQEYENLYYQRRMDRIHLCRPCLHTLIHIGPEATRIGPGTYISQYTMERSIGDLGQQIRQPSNPFANLCQIALRRSQLNALKSMCPELDTEADNSLPAYSHDNGDGYIFLAPRQKRPTLLQDVERQIVEAEFQRSLLRKWGRLRLPNGQIARSIFSEGRRMSPNMRITRNLKLSLDGKIEFGEAQFYFQLVDPEDDDKFNPYALVSIYGPPDADMLEQSHRTLWACLHRGSDGFRVIPISSIISVVSMQPLPHCPGDPENLWFVVEKSGLDDTELTGYVDPLL